MAAQISYSRHPSHEEVNALLESSSRNLEAARALQIEEPNGFMSSMKKIVNFSKGILFGSFLATAFIWGVNVLKVFLLWPFSFIISLIKKGLGIEV